MMKKILLPLVFLVSMAAFSQSGKSEMKIMFYNVENLFDPEDEPDKSDEEFTPKGTRYWSYPRYRQKLSNISKVIVALGGWEAPALIGLCEVENRKTMEDLTQQAPLKRLGYQFIHQESPDERGIDVALLYQKEKYQPVHEEFIEINFPQDPSRKTRDILYSSGVVPTGDTLHVFVNHFPSRYGGELVSEPNRIFVASLLRRRVDSLLARNPQSLIVIMGDFNDHPDNRSIRDVLNAHEVKPPFKNTELYNLFALYHAQGMGSYKFQGEWGALDQMIVSGALLTGEQRVSTTQDNARVFRADFLLETDNMGDKPFRTYTGFRFNGGFSDHLPIYTIFTLNNKPNN
ncbi:MAG: endonuclease [Prevotellaceae bacterium]|jgi:predicted extracellular nuclease|nr:endonuclease [Prevotellaceae bacterium]